MKKLALALGLLWFASAPTLAQQVNCQTRPPGTSDNSCASTAFVQNAVLPLVVKANANTFFSGPSSGSPAIPTFRSITTLDLDVNTTGTSGHKIPYLDQANTWSLLQTIGVDDGISEAGNPLLKVNSNTAIFSSSSSGSAAHSQPQIVFRSRDTITPGGAGGTLNFQTPNALGVYINGARINGGLVGVTSGNEQGDLDFVVYRNGAAVVPLALRGDLSAILADTASVWNIGTSSIPYLNAYFSGAGQFATSLITGTQTVVSSSSAVLDVVSVPADTTTILGSTHITTPGGFNKVTIGQPVYSAGSSLTIDNAATLRVAGAPSTAGLLAITNPYAVWATGTSRFDGVIVGTSSGVFSGMVFVAGASTNAVSTPAQTVDFNSANTDTAFTIALPAGFTKYILNTVNIYGASTSLTTSTFGVFTATGGGGTPVVASGTANTVSATTDQTANSSQAPVLAISSSQYSAGTLYFRVQTPQGSAATGKVTITYRPIP